MKTVETGLLPVDDIEVGKRLRSIDAGVVQALAKVIEEDGQYHPIVVMRVDNRFVLASGAHRLAAIKLLGRGFIDARVLEPETDKPDLEIRKIEIGENLARRELNALDRAAHVAELKGIYQALLDATHGGDRVSKKKKEQSANIALWSLGDEVAGRIGLSKRTVFADVELWNGLSAASKKRLVGTDLAENRAQLAQLAKEEPEAQAKVLDLMLAEEPKARSVSDALSIVHNKVDPRDPNTETFDKFIKLWGKASKNAKRQIASYIDKHGVK